MKKTLLTLIVPLIIGCSANQNYRRNIEEFPDSVVTPLLNQTELGNVLKKLGRITYYNIQFDADGKLDPVFLGKDFGYIAPTLSVQRGSPGTTEDDKMVWYKKTREELGLE